MIFIPFALLLVSALLCWGLDRFVRTRWLGLLASLASLASLVLVLVMRQTRSLPSVSSPYTWIEAAGLRVVAGLSLDGLNSLLAIVLLLGGSLCLWSLSRSVSPALTGYGRLFAALLLALASGLLGLLSTDLLVQLFGWGMLALAGSWARRIVGALDSGLPAALVQFLPGALLILGAVLAFGLGKSGSFVLSATDSGAVTVEIFLLWTLGAAVVTGLLLVARSGVDENGPLQLHGLLLGGGLPLLASYSLLRLYAVSLGQASWPEGYGWVLVGLGAIAALAGAAIALRSRHLATTMSWQLSSQLGLMLLALGMRQPAAAPAAIALLLNASLSTIVAGLALAALVRRTGSERPGSQRRMASPLVWPGIAYGLAAASAIGIPPLWGFWSRIWLLDAAPGAPWLLPILLLSGMLLALSYLGPLAIFWRAGSTSIYQKGLGADRRRRANLPAVVAALLLALISLLPVEVWSVFLRVATVEILPPDSVGGLEMFLPGRPGQAGLAVFALVAILLVRWRSTSDELVPFAGGEPLDPDDGTPLDPAMFGSSMRSLAFVAEPAPLQQLLGRALYALAGAVQWVLQVVGGRYYLTGVFVAMILMLIVMVS